MTYKKYTPWVFALATAIVFAPAVYGRADDSPPGWMRQAASAAIPSYDKDVPAVALLDEKQVALNGDGRLVTNENFAVKVLTREGRDYALARTFYFVSTGKIKDFSAWIIRPDGSSKSYDKKMVLDMIADRDDVYNEGRYKVIDATGDVDVGYVFGYSVVSEETALFYQDTWGFQGPIPTLVSRYALNLPSGWKASSITFNSPTVTPRVNGSAYTWEMHDLAPIVREPMSPAPVNMAARIAINYTPDSSDKSANRVFGNWADVSRWATALHDPQVIVDDEVAAKARDLTANAQTELEKIQAIGKYVQNLQYISIDIGVGYGNGYKPRSSSLVLSRGYGDCKDKANLMRALLRALKIEAYPIAIFSGDPAFVREEWPSPDQFNHCIIAIRVSDATKGAVILDHPKLGRLLIFDATDAYTPVGDLPDYLQGSLALIAAGDSGGLSRMPITPPDTDRLERNVEVALGTAGEIKGTIHEKALGQASTFFRSEYRNSSPTDYRKMLEGWLTNGATGATVDTFQTKDNVDTMAFDLDVAFSAARYGQLMQGRLLVFRPVIVSRRNAVYLTESKRKNPIEINALSVKETAVFALPDGFAVDEMPSPVNLETTFGKYTTTYEVKANKLYFTRAYVLNRALLPVEKYSIAREFFTAVRQAEQSQVVLIKK